MREWWCRKVAITDYEYDPEHRTFTLGLATLYDVLYTSVYPKVSIALELP